MRIKAGIKSPKNGIYCLNVSFFTRFRRVIANFCIKFRPPFIVR